MQLKQLNATKYNVESGKHIMNSGGSPVEVWVGSGLPRVQRHWQQQFWEVPLGKQALLEVVINPATESVDSRAESPQAKQLIGREPHPSADYSVTEHDPAHQDKTQFFTSPSQQDYLPDERTR